MTSVEPRPTTTNNAGIPVASDEHSLTVGPGGPILLHDSYLIEKMAQFNRERVPERVVHAKGGGAFGEFVVTEDVSAWTKADFLQPGRRTEMLARFSTVAPEQGGADALRVRVARDGCSDAVRGGSRHASSSCSWLWGSAGRSVGTAQLRRAWRGWATLPGWDRCGARQAVRAQSAQRPTNVTSAACTVKPAGASACMHGASPTTQSTSSTRPQLEHTAWW